MGEHRDVIAGNLSYIWRELAHQPSVGKSFPPGLMPYADWIEQVREFIEDANEFGIAYEYIVAALEVRPFTLTGRAAVKLLEVGLFLSFKTERSEDAAFDMRPGSGA